jgi:transcriptional regulator with XRE-family HTH domain
MRKVSQMKLAEYCDSSAGYIGEIEIGNKFPSIEMVEKIAAALEIEPHVLFQNTDCKKYSSLEQECTIPGEIKQEIIQELTASIHKVMTKY